MKICDTHNDFLTELEPKEFGNYCQKCRSDGVKTICASYWSSKRENIEIDIVERAKALRQCSDFLLHIEDLWWVQDEDRLEFLLTQKPFSCSLTWNDKNVFASGSKSKGGVTDWGQKCLKILEQNHIVVDLAHLNRQSFFEVTTNLKQKLYCSHTGFCGVKNHNRNLTDEQIDIIVRSGGFVGLFFYDKCVQISGSFSTLDIVENIKYFTSRWGFDNIGIGSDFYGIDTMPCDIQNYADFENLSNCLLKEGFDDNQIEKFFHQNFEDFCLRFCL